MTTKRTPDEVLMGRGRHNLLLIESNVRPPRMDKAPAPTRTRALFRIIRKLEAELDDPIALFEGDEEAQELWARMSREANPNINRARKVAV